VSRVETICVPDLSARPISHTVERVTQLPPDALYRAWTVDFDRWFAAPGTLLMKPEVNAPFFFEARHEGQRHPHYGRFLRLEPDRLIELTWVTGAGGTNGLETVVTVELIPQEGGTLLRLTHAGWDEGSTSGEAHHEAWSHGLEHMENQLRG
jgi:uncharacterized protein YndB with AHSA1/START domain